MDKKPITMNDRYVRQRTQRANDEIEALIGQLSEADAKTRMAFAAAVASAAAAADCGADTHCLCDHGCCFCTRSRLTS